MASPLRFGNRVGFSRQFLALLTVVVAGCTTATSATPSAPSAQATPGGSSAAGPTQEAGTDQLVFASFGGTFQAAQMNTLVVPFGAKNAIKVTGDTVPGVAKMVAAAQTNTSQWDIVEVDLGELLALTAENALEPIDYSSWDQATLAAVPEDQRLEFGVGAVTTAQGIAYRTDLGDAHPTTWAEFWDTTKFPGPRALPRGKGTVWEAALVASGVAPDQLYPLDYERGKASLDKIKPNVKVWWNTLAEATQALVSGDVNYAIITNGRVAAAKGQGAPVDMELNQAFNFRDFYVVPKGAPNRVNAMKFLAYASQAEPSAALMAVIPYSTPNQQALTFLDPTYAKQLPGYPDNAKKAIKIDFEWYGTKLANGKTNQDVTLEEWTKWFGS